MNDLSRRAVFVLAALTTGCENPSSGDEQLHQDNTCTATLEYGNTHAQFQTCRATYAEAIAEPVCASVGTTIRGIVVAGNCGELLQVRVAVGGTHSWTCFYDPATRALVGRIETDDSPHYCDMRTSSLRSGRVSDCMPTTTDVNAFCNVPDASAADASSGD